MFPAAPGGAVWCTRYVGIECEVPCSTQAGWASLWAAVLCRLCLCRLNITSLCNKSFCRLPTVVSVHICSSYHRISSFHATRLWNLLFANASRIKRRYDQHVLLGREEIASLVAPDDHIILLEHPPKRAMHRMLSHAAPT